MPVLRSFETTSVKKDTKQLTKHFKHVALSTDLGVEFESFLDEELDEQLDDDDDSDHFQPFIANKAIWFALISQQQHLNSCGEYLPKYSKNLYLRNRNLRI
ncbi:MAG: hypothetical protein EBU82_06255 [Flavobacteriia bacterium]|jgi:hypothetical protein|nr:hypothetical protein [Flavobacteriia bacterium]